MTSKAFSLDWVKCTFAWDGVKDPLLCGPLESEDYEDARAPGGYTDQKTCKTHSYSWHSSKPEMKVMLQMSGSQLDEYRRGGGQEKQLVHDCAVLRGNFTRIDYAIDLYDTDGTPYDLLAAWECNQVETVARSMGAVETKERKKSRGATVYVGSRQSERMVRVYEKGKQKGLSVDWIRVELEAKGARANQLGFLISTRGVSEAGNSMLLDFVEWTDVPWFNEIWGNEFEVIDINSIGRPETKRERWLRLVVVPVIETELKSGNSWLLGALVTLIEDSEIRANRKSDLSPYPNK